MEIDKAIRECDDGRLRTKYNNSIYVIQRAFSLYSIEEIAFSFNGGKDSTVLLHLLRASYFLHKGGQNSPNGSLKGFPIRTIYFETPSTFPEINSFTYDTAATYGLPMDNIRLDLKSGLEDLLKNKPIRAIFLGVRIGDPTAIGQEQFSPSSPGWPPFMRVNPILDWSYRDVWAFLLTCNVQYCCLYDQGYTSIGSIYDTVPNALLSIGNSSNEFKHAYMLSDGRLERAGRAKNSSTWRRLPANGNGLNSLDLHKTSLLTASIIVVGDEILYGIAEDQLGPSLCRKLHSVGWSVPGVAVVHNNAPDESFGDCFRHIIGDQCTGDWNMMVQLPEGITKLLHHDKLSMPLIKCQNVVVLCATNALELEEEWDCLIELTKSSDLFALPEAYMSKNVTTNLSDVDIAQPLTKLCLEYPDLYIGCHRKSRYGSLVVSFTGKDQSRIESAVEALYKKFGSDALMDMN
ncbi:uncharacterized protein LOC129316772 isoform X3 [Prosopis cineraria]|uniref:uncharacterized protein LOC129316772 isoform X3 n=1 Tax=Prosopis cineraria TaxID=364024 RepID=UPI00240F6E07|nr:uncharacterized protein LOC129316772 isoform X3 [Prosopis cineraria]